ncbi:MAG: hypothetical protein Q8O59_02305 [bacterium]|nr:hypothetical protein [bacterium]
MGIQVEFNPDLALRNISEFKNGEEAYTKGKYKVIDIFHDNEIHFENLDRIK